MNSEIIFSQKTTWTGRYLEDEGEEITVFSDFSKPDGWPYRIEKRTWCDDDSKTKTANLSPQVFDRIKKIIAAHPELTSYSEAVVDDDDEHDSHHTCTQLFFGCDSFRKKIHGCAFLYKWNRDFSENRATTGADIYRIIHEILITAKGGGADFIRED